jgi:hypothetical protein
MPSPSRSIILGACAGVALLGFSGLPGLGLCLFCIGFLAPGLVAVWHYSKAAGGQLSAVDGLRMGAQAGLLACGLLFLTSTLVWLLQGRPDLIAPMLEAMEQDESGLFSILAEQGDEGADVVAEMEATLRSPLFRLLSALISAAMLSIGGALGGALGSGIFGRSASRQGLES